LSTGKHVGRKDSHQSPGGASDVPPFGLSALLWIRRGAYLRTKSVLRYAPPAIAIGCYFERGYFKSRHLHLVVVLTLDVQCQL
jgi:hypothetical protein